VACDREAHYQMHRKTLTRMAAMFAVPALLTTVIAGGTLPAGAAAGTVIRAGSTSMVDGQQGTSTTSVQLAASDASFNAFDITLKFDPTVATVASVTPAAGWSLMPAPRIDNTTGTVQVIAVRFDACGSPCSTFSITWNGVGAGTTSLTLAGSADTSLAQAGMYITGSFTAGSVTVSEPAKVNVPPVRSWAPVRSKNKGHDTSTVTSTTTATPAPSSTPAPKAASTKRFGHR
jgi:hypothetical protein